MKIDVQQIKRYLLPSAPYTVIFIIIWRLMPQLPFALPVSDIIVALTAAIILRIVVHFKGKNAKRFRKDVEFGSARFGTAKDIKPFVDPDPKNNVILTKTESLTMNSRPKPVKYARNKNVLVIGGSGSGKTRFYVKPNIMQCESQDYPISFCITDPKGVRPDRVE